MAEEAEVVTPVIEPQPPVTPTPEPQPETPTRTYSQKEVDEIAAKIKENSRRRREEARRDADAWKRMALELQEKAKAHVPAPSQPADNSQRPKQESFTDYNEYMEAVADWKAEQKIREREAIRTKEDEERRNRESMQKAQTSFSEREVKAREKYEDYDDVTKDSTLPVSQAMAHAIINLDNGTDILYWLGKNRADAARIAGLNPIVALVELGKIGAKLDAPPAPKQPSAAPQPITPVGGKATPTNSDEPSENDEIGTWIRKRSKQAHGQQPGWRRR